MKPAYSIWQLIIYMLKLGTWGFGGPVALAGYMHRDLVEKLQWITEADYKEGLALAQLAPGPMAAQLAIYLGYVHFRILGATLAGIAFVLPSFLMVVALGWAYLAYGELAWMQAVFYGVGAAVIGIIAISAQKLTQKTIGKDRLLWVIPAMSHGLRVVEVPFPPRFQGRGVPRFRHRRLRLEMVGDGNSSGKIRVGSKRIGASTSLCGGSRWNGLPGNTYQNPNQREHDHYFGSATTDEGQGHSFVRE
jgi:chromate transport protein ChrA